MPAHPTREQVDAEYAKVWTSLGDRPIESLIDLRAHDRRRDAGAMRVQSVLFAPAYFTDTIWSLATSAHVNLSMKYGRPTSRQAYSWFGTTLGSTLERYIDATVSERSLRADRKHVFLAGRAKTYFPMEMSPLDTAIGDRPGLYPRRISRRRRSRRPCIACSAATSRHRPSQRAGTPSTEVWRESERAMDFVRKAKFLDVVDIVVARRFIDDMRGRTAHFSTFSERSSTRGRSRPS